MNFITYSQNFEDLMLWRALKDVKKGFYIDVGANDPIADSVTKALYDKNWRGINIEPEYRFYRALKKDRIRDINLNCAVSSKYKEIPLYVSKLRGWSTTNTEVSKEQEKNCLVDEIVNVEAKTLDEIIFAYKSEIEEIHFLKVDVEGAEKDVLESFSFSPLRPWIIMVESTSPGTNVDVSNTWEHILFSKDYLEIYFDGVNKYYVAKEKEELKKAFVYPPNVVDDWIHIDHKHAQESVQRLQKQVELGNAQIELLLKKLHKAKLVEKTLEDVLNSKSWKITEPLRHFMAFLKREEKKVEQENVEKEKQKKLTQEKQKLTKEGTKIYKDLTCE